MTFSLDQMEEATQKIAAASSEIDSVTKKTIHTLREIAKTMDENGQAAEAAKQSEIADKAEKLAKAKAELKEQKIAPGFFSTDPRDETPEIRAMKEAIAISTAFWDSAAHVLGIEDVEKFLFLMEKVNTFDAFMKERGH